MCNYLHDNYKPIPKKGFGWKIFQVKNGELCSLLAGDFYKKNEGEWVEWDWRYGDGFCFYLSRDEARRALREWVKRDPLLSEMYKIKYKVAFIEYEKGLGSFVEKNMIKGCDFEIALCQKFRVINKESNGGK